MKRVIFCEGKNDTLFLKELLINRLAILKEDRILFCDQDSGEIKKNLKFAEDRYFGQLETEWMPFELLAKSEGGKEKVIDITVSQLPYLCKNRHDPIMLIDLDDKGIDVFIDRLKEKLIHRHRGLTIDSSELRKIDDALMHSLKLSKNNKALGTIYVIGICSSLERVTGITDNTPEIERRELSRRYIETSEIHNMFTLAFNNA